MIATIVCGASNHVENDEIVKRFNHNSVPDNAQVKEKPKGSRQCVL